MILFQQNKKGTLRTSSFSPSWIVYFFLIWWFFAISAENNGKLVAGIRTVKRNW